MESVIFAFIGIGTLIGGVDAIFNNRFGIGKKFTEGIQTLGPLTLGMSGIICLSPLIADVLKPLSQAFYQSFHIDAAIFGSLLACDMGGYALAQKIAINPQMGSYAGMVIASMLGCTVSFLIPVGLNLLKKEDVAVFFKGIMFGITGIFFGSVLGGFLAGYPLPDILKNTFPVLLFSGILILGLAYRKNAVIAGCIGFGKVISVLCIGGLAAAGFQMITGTIILPGMEPVENTMMTVGKIGIFLMGALPAMEILNRLLEKIAKLAGKKVCVRTMSGYFFILVNPLPVLMDYNKLEKQEKIRLAAFMVCASCALGDHLGFAVSAAPGLAMPLIAGKIVGGMAALLIEMISDRRNQ